MLGLKLSFQDDIATLHAHGGALVALDILLRGHQRQERLQYRILLDAILAKVEKKGVEAPKLIETLKELRNIALQEQDPLVVKTLRLMYEFIEENKNFSVQAQYEEDDEGNEYPLEIEDTENLVYLLTLLKDAEHKINREEIKDYRSVLKEQLY
jgi:hypothetical protein